MSLTRQGSGAWRRGRRLCVVVGLTSAVAAYSQAALAQQCPPPHTVSGADLNPDGDGTLAWSGSGIGFAVIKATQGDYYTDGDFSDNWAALKAAGVARGAYHFFDATVSGAAQANYFLGVIGTLEPGDLPPTLDIECPVYGEDDCLGNGSSGAAPASQITQAMNDFLTTVKAATGVTPIVYSYGSWFSDNGVDTTGLQNYPLWLADYNSCYTVPSPWNAATIWQYDDSGSVGGINVDDDYFLGSMGQLAAFTVGNASGSGTGTGTATSSSASVESSSTGDSSTDDSSTGNGSSGSGSSGSGSSGASEVDAGDGVGTSCTVTETGQTGECMDTSACAAMGGYTSTPGYCPGPANVECCTADGDNDAGVATTGASEGGGSSSAGGSGGSTSSAGGGGAGGGGAGGGGGSGAGGFGGGGGGSGAGGFGGGGGGSGGSGGGGGVGGTLPGAPTGGGGSGPPSHGGEGANASGGFGVHSSGCAVGRRDPVEGLSAALMTSVVAVLIRRRRRASVPREG